MDARLYTIGDLAEVLGITVSAIHSHLARRNHDAIPIPIKLGRRLVWPVETVEEWIRAKIEKAQTATDRANLQLSLPAKKMGRPRKTRSGR